MHTTHTTDPFFGYDDVLKRLALGANTTTCVEISDFTLRTRVGLFVTSRGANGSYALTQQSSNEDEDKDEDQDDEDEDEEDEDATCAPVATELRLGSGVHAFEWRGHALTAVVEKMTLAHDVKGTLFLLDAVSNGPHTIKAFCDELLLKKAKSYPTFKIFRTKESMHVGWHWVEDQEARARTMDSVVLEKASKAALVDDVNDFVGVTSRNWYLRHGVPYRRSYLLHGPPGSGKTSVVQALAAALERPLCVLSPIAQLNDGQLRELLDNVPSRALILIEDIDSLFTRSRRKRDLSALSFSGLLNGLDGVGESDGRLVFLTTNHRNRLDAALIRPGRVDVHVPFLHAESEQMKLMYRSFYPDAPSDLAQAFERRLQTKLGALPAESMLTADGITGEELERLPAVGGRRVSMALLQNYFVLQRRGDAHKAIDNLDVLVNLLDDMAHADHGADRDE